MNIGLTYDLRDDHRAEGLTEYQVAEFDRIETIDRLDAALRAHGHVVDRIGHAKSLVQRLASGDRWDLVFNIAEGRFGYGREALVPALLEAYEIPVTFSDSLVSAVTLHKATTKRVLRDSGIATTDFALISELTELEQVTMPYPVFAKPVAEGSSKGVGLTSRASNAEELATIVGDLLERFHQPVLVEPYLSGREFTVGILGTDREARAIGALEVCLRASAEPGIYTYANKEDCETHVDYVLKSDSLAQEACRVALDAWRAIGARDGGRVDLRADGKGTLHVIEVNPLPGMHPEHSDLPILATQAGISFVELVGAVLESAARRIVLEPERCTS
ncbi:Ddl-like protein [Planctomycetes bacterium Poly30]|uniref:D-alanine--D-alanine ligase n=1 Tax=Saltatorellus ferox TaxID=2528018 RepID=A0A518EW83_9BACT|nr:Ddl-like protein [Planctomycetes bacterium Poly30]